MLLFLSEEHVEKWLKDWHLPRGAILSLHQCWHLAKALYSPDRREPKWRRLTVDEYEALFAGLGLTSSFWNLRMGS